MYCLKETGNFTMLQPSCPVNIGYTINAPDNFASIYSEHPAHYHRRSTTTHLRGAEQLAQGYCNGPVFWAYLQETQVCPVLTVCELLM